MIKKDLFKIIDYIIKRPKTVVIILVLIALSPLFINLIKKFPLDGFGYTFNLLMFKLFELEGIHVTS